jgi:hypothetical protein
MSCPPHTLDRLIQSVHAAIEERHGVSVPGHRRKHEARFYSWGSSLEFLDGGGAPWFFGPGWSEPELQSCWTCAKSAELHLPVRPLQGKHLLLTSLVRPLVSAATPAQLIRVSVNDAPVCQWTVRDPGLLHAIVFERHFAGKNTLNLRFDLPNAFSPQSQGISADFRLLALAFHSLSLSPVNL